MDQSISNPPKCAGGCGFFGNPANANMCSKCFRNQPAAPRQETPAVLSPPAPVPIPVASPAPSSSSGSEGAESTSLTPTKKNRCVECKKKVGILGFTCRCEGLFCSEHRHADGHNCQFDYKTMDRERLAKANPAVVAEKIQRL